MDKIEKALMKTIYLEATKEPGVNECVLTDIDLLKGVPYKVQLFYQHLDEYIKSLDVQNYFDYETYEKEGSKYYNFKLLNKGKSFIKEIESEKRAIKFKIILTVSGTIGSFILARILAAIFGK